MTASPEFFWTPITTTEGDAMEHQCTDCMVGQGRGCRCAEFEPPGLGSLLLMLPFIALMWLADGAKAALKKLGVR